MSAQTQAEGGREQTPGVLGHRMAFVDVLRAVAILTVIVHHLPEELHGTWGQLAVWGGRGVDLFFVLSGFLIGSTCLERAEKSGQAGLVNQAKAYWLLRSLRIFPLYFALLAIFALGLPGFNPDAAYVLRHWPQPFVTFTSNHFGQGTLELGIFWSLAIEEQFYLAVGLLVLFCSRNRQTLASAFFGLALAAIAMSLVHRHHLVDLHADGLLPENGFIFKLFHSTLARMDQLALGLISAIVAPTLNRLSVARDTRWVRATTWTAIAGAVALLVYYPHRNIVGPLVLGLVFAGSLLWVQRPAVRTLALGVWEARLMAPLVYVGKLSFGLYLFHPITRRWVDMLLPTSALPAGSGARSVVFVGVWILGTTVLAGLSYRFFEEPLLAIARRKSKQFLQPPTPAQPVEPEVVTPVAAVR